MQGNEKMKPNTHQKSHVPNRMYNRRKSSFTHPKKIIKSIFGNDDFLNRIIAMKEQGNLVISGCRIC